MKKRKVSVGLLAASLPILSLSLVALSAMPASAAPPPAAPSATPAPAGPVVESSGIQWVKSVTEANEQIKASGKLVMFYFNADDCPDCRKLDKVTHNDSRVVALSGEFIPVKVNADRGNGPALAQTYGVTEFPYTFFLDAGGKVVHEIVGYVAPDEYALELAQVLQKNSESRMRNDAGSGDAGVLARAAVMYAMLKNTERAATNLSRAEKANAKAANPKKNGADLAAAYIAIGDAYVDESSYDKAIVALLKVPAVSIDVGDITASRLKLASAYIENDELPKAAAVLNETLAAQDITVEERRAAEALLAKAR